MTVVALSVAPNGHTVMVELPDSSHDQLRALCRLIGCAAVVAVVVEPDLLIWLDDNHIDPVAVRRLLVHLDRRGFHRLGREGWSYHVASSQVVESCLPGWGRRPATGPHHRLGVAIMGTVLPR